MSLWNNTDSAESKPKFIKSEAELAQVVGVDVAEAQNDVNRAKGIKNPGWVKTVSYTDAQGNVRNKTETLVAFSSITGDNDAATLPSPVITIGTQPVDAIALEGETASFTVAATVTEGAVLSYQWQKLDGTTWSNVVGATSATYTTGILTVEDNDGSQYRVVVSATLGAKPVTSDVVTLEVTL